MGETDERIETLKRGQGRIAGQAGGVEAKYQGELNAPATGQHRDERIAELTGERNNLQERLARVQGELSELERGRDAQQKLDAARQSGPQSVNPDPAQQSPAGQNPPTQAAQQPPIARTDGAGAPAAETLSDPQLPQSPRNETSPGNAGPGAPTRSSAPTPTEQDKPQKGFGPFEPGGPPGGFDPADVSSSVAPFERPKPGEGFPGEWQEKTPASVFKPFSEVLHNKQVAELDALDDKQRAQDAPDSKERLALDAEKQKLGLETAGASREFEKNQFENKVDQMHRLFNEHDRERQQFGANEHVVDREMDLKRYDTTRDLCRTRAEEEIGDKHRDLKNEEARKNDVLREKNEKRLAGREDAEVKQKAYEKDLSDNLAKFEQKLQADFPGQVKQRTDALQEQHFPAVVENGPVMSAPEIATPAPAAPAMGSSGQGGPPPPQGPASGPPPPAM